MNICCDAEFEEWEGQMERGPNGDYVNCKCSDCKQLRKGEKEKNK